MESHGIAIWIFLNDHAPPHFHARYWQFKIIVEKHSDGYVACPLGMRGIVAGEGDSCEEAIADVKSAIRFHIETFGDEVLPNDSPLIEACVA